VSAGTSSSVAVIGGAGIDIYGKSHAALRERDSNPGDVLILPGGVGRNVAQNLARLGVNCRLFTVVGNDQYGEMLLALGRSGGIDMQYVQQVDSFTTSTYLAVLDDAGDMLVAIADMDIMKELDPARLQPHRESIADSSLIIVDTNVSEESLGWIANTFADRTLFVDTVSAAKAPRIKPYLGSVHTLKTSTVEAEALSGLEARTEGQLRKVAKWVHEQGVDRLFITRGGSGVFYSTRDAVGSMTIRSDEDVVSTSGAGDAFLAGLAYAWLEDWKLERSVSFALAAAQVTVANSATSSPALSLTAIDLVLEKQFAG
jgi:pseudouridine kinase